MVESPEKLEPQVTLMAPGREQRVDTLCAKEFPRFCFLHQDLRPQKYQSSSSGRQGVLHCQKHEAEKLIPAPAGERCPRLCS